MSESEEQQALFRWARFASGRYPVLRLMYHIPNEGKRSVSYGARLKAEGLLPGVPDICLPAASGKYHGLYVEMKAGRNTATPDQAAYMERLAEQGYFVAVCYGWQQASELITAYLKGEV